MENKPLPAGVTPPTEWEIYQQQFWDWVDATYVWISDTLVIDLQTFVQTMGQYALDYAPYIGIVLVVWAVVWVLLQRAHRYQNQVQRLWLFILFFLSKRQMMIPLVHTLCERDDLLPQETLNKLVTIRQQCSQLSLKRDPQKRMQAEAELSRILYGAFMNMEKAGKLPQAGKLSQLIEDFEFIDGKLVELQEKYNLASLQFNDTMIDSPMGKTLYRLGGFDRFAPFVSDAS